MTKKFTFNVIHQITVSEKDFKTIKDRIKDLIFDYIWDDLAIPEDTPYELIDNIRNNIYNAIIKEKEEDV